MQDIDAELSAVTRSFGTAATMIIRATPRGGPSATGRGGVPRQTLAPSARRIRRMSTGRLTGYMWKTHLRGAHGVNVSAETRRISSELQARGLVGVNQQWRELTSSHTHHNHVQQAEGQADTRPAERRHQQPVAQQVSQQQVSHQWATPQIAAAVAGLGAGAGGFAVAGERLADAVDQHLVTLGLDGRLNADHNHQAGEENSTEHGKQPAAGQEAGVEETSVGADQSSQQVADPTEGISGQPGEVTSASAADRVDSGAEEQSSPAPGGDVVGDLLAVGAVAEAVEAGQFGAEAISGEIGQALADETGGDGLSSTPEAEQAASPAHTPQAAEAEPGV